MALACFCFHEVFLTLQVLLLLFMKELHIFYAPDVEQTHELTSEDSAHAVRVLRMREDDEVTLTDGKGQLIRARITIASQKHCRVEILEKIGIDIPWHGGIHIAVAPTKNMDRMEWFAEKATEIGLDSITFLNCRNSERRIVKTERIEKIVVAAMKQSHKTWLPKVVGMTDYDKFLSTPFDGEKYIAHCYNAADIQENGDVCPMETPLLWDKCKPDEHTLVLIGPEGDFSIEEVRKAISAGFKPISLGKSRLRTETAALAAVHIMNIKKTYT